MPEVRLGHEKFFSHIAKSYGAESDYDGTLRPSIVKEYARYSGVELLGSGASHIVVGDWADKGKVSAWSYKDGLTETQSKQLYYTHRILAILFPHNFPRFHAVFWNKSDRLSGEIRERIDPDFFQYRPTFPYHKTVYQRMSIPLSIEIDSRQANFVVGKGGEYYVDVINTENVTENIINQEDKVLKYMKQSEYDRQGIYRVEKSIARLQGLAGKGMTV